MRAFNVLLSILVSALLAFLVFEGGLRLIPAFRPQETLNRFDARLGWSKRPNAEVGRATSEFSVTFETNAEGLRDDPRAELAKPPNTYRVLALGDSFVLGYTVEREDLFVDQLERWWIAEGRRVDVVNAGTEGWSTDQEVLWFLEHGADYEPDLVLLFPYENDLYWNGEASYQRFPKPRFEPDGTLEERALADPGPGPKLGRFAIGRLLALEVLPLVARLKRGDAPPPGTFRPEGTDAWILREFAPLLRKEPAFLADAVARTRGALSALKGRCDELGARLVMVPIPAESAIDPAQRERFRERGMGGLPDELWSADKPVNAFLDAARALGIETLDPRSALRARAEGGGALYFDAEWHFTPAGNEALATFLHDELDARNVFPDAHGAIAIAELPDPHAGEGGIPGWVALFLVLWAVLGIAYASTYRDEPALLGVIKVGCLLAVIFLIVIGGGRLLRLLPPGVGVWVAIAFVALVIGFVAFKLGRRLGTVAELLKSFTLRGHWYLMPLVVVLLSIGSLLVVAASSPLIAPFIYTLF